jgi:HSP20 family protein
MAIEQWDPLSEAVSLRDAVNSLFQDSFVRPRGFPGTAAPGTFPIDVRENENDYVIHASLPGIKPDDVQITVHGDTLTIRGEHKGEEEKKGEHWHIRERRSGVFQRSLSLGAPVSSDRAEATFENGVLTLTLPKAEEAKPRQIKIGSRSGDGVKANGPK